MLLFIQKDNNKYICAICDKTEILKIIFIYRDPPKKDEVFSFYEKPKDKLNELILELKEKNWIDAYIPDIVLKDKNFEQVITMKDIFM